MERGQEGRTAVNSARARILLETLFGPIEAELYPEAAPVTVANFMHYVDLGFYDRGTFHRTVTMRNQPQNEIKIEVIQGGVDPSRKSEVGAPIPLERTTLTGLRHGDGAISMARFAPDSALSDFFICIGDQPELDFGGKRNPDGQGFASFGQVTRGMDVVRQIQESPHDQQQLTPPVVIQQIRRLD
jgi:peptidyl-prolyl cis-trans isomerase A (cyclophilin A)